VNLKVPTFRKLTTKPKVNSMKRVMPIKSQRKGFPTVLAFVLALLTILSAANVALAATAAGSVIRNQASATYKTDDGIERFATSNVVETVVRQVAGFQIFQTQTDYTNAGGQLVFPHLINNIGNGPDSIILTAEQFVSDDFNFLSVEIFADADHDGKPDNLTPISSTPELLPNEAYTIVAIVNVPNDIEAGKVGKVRIRGRSTLDNTVTKSNVNTAIVKTGAIISISKKMSITEGDASSGTFTITLNYRNDGTSTATDFVLMDPLPIDMTYVPDSGRWSDTESTVLTDSNPTDVQLGDTTSIIYCAYVPSCIDLPESVRDGDTLVSNQVTAIIADVPPGRSGTLTFQARIRPNRAAKTVQNVAEFEYKDGATDIARAFSNFASFKIASTRNVVANGSAVDSANATAEPVNVITASQGSTVSFANYIWNSGNDTDRFDLVIDTAGSNFPPGTVFQLFREDGATPLLDSSGNGVPDTGPVESNTNVNVFLRATLPPDAVGNNAGAGYTVSLRAISTNNPSAFDDVINKLDSITPGSVDLTNNAALNFIYQISAPRLMILC